MTNETNITVLHAIIANLVDIKYGSLQGGNKNSWINMISVDMDISPEMAETIVNISRKVSETGEFDPI